jgi:hypothetical protein
MQTAPRRQNETFNSTPGSPVGESRYVGNLASAANIDQVRLANQRRTVAPPSKMAYHIAHCLLASSGG